MKKIILFEEFSSERKAPINFIEDDNKLFAHELYKTFPQVYFYEVKNLHVINTSVYKLTRLKFFSKYNYFYKPKKIRLFKDVYTNIYKSTSVDKTISSGIWITDNKTGVYFHFLCDALTRYEALPESYKNQPVLLPNVYSHSWIIEILEYLGIDYIILEKNTKYKLNHALITSYTAPSGNFHQQTLLKLRNNFLNRSTEINTNDKKINKIWIDMSKHRRPVQNIDEIRPILKKHGITEVLFEELSIEEKINLMKNVDVLIGSHSSGLTNMLFMKSETKVIDIRDPNDKIKNAFFTMASELNISYYYMEREPDLNTTYIDPEKIDNLLSSLN